MSGSTYVGRLPQLSALPLQQGGPRLQTSAVIPPPLISALLLHRDVLPPQPSDVCDAPTPPPLYVSIQGRGGPPPQISDVRAYGLLLQQWEVMRAYRENALFCDTRIIDMTALVILHKLT